MNDALARGDSAALKRFAGQLLETAPNSALSMWAKNVLA
jgi:hypothetical protein